MNEYVEIYLIWCLQISVCLAAGLVVLGLFACIGMIFTDIKRRFLDGEPW